MLRGSMKKMLLHGIVDCHRYYILKNVLLLILLTILALIQRQGRELPSQRIELFDLCATTLLKTWVAEKGMHTHLTKNELVRMLCPLAFWMHEHPEVNAIPLEELNETILRQARERGFTQREAEEQIVRLLYNLSIRD
jgi:predicted NACHT family NTPase